VIVRAAQADNHIALRFVVANALDEAAAVNVAAFKCFEIDGAASSRYPSSPPMTALRLA
jgi:hypothetical protein